MSDTPKISVVMPVMNEERYIHASIDSILAQTFSDFEFVIIDDGSTDATPDILADYATRDSRFRILINETNRGIAHTLNTGLRAARGDYIARMDGDDVNTPDRFEKQLAALEADPELVVIGAGYQTIDGKGRVKNVVVEGVENWECDWMSIFRTPILHSIMMYRRATLTDNNILYDPAYECAEDFEFLHRLLRHGAGRCLPEEMLIRRFHPDNTSSQNAQKQRSAFRQAAILNAKRRFPEIDAENIKYLFHYLKAPVGAPAPGAARAVSTMNEIESHFTARYDLSSSEAALMKRLSSRWLAAAALRTPGAAKAQAISDLIVAGRRYSVEFAQESIGYLRRRFASPPQHINRLNSNTDSYRPADKAAGPARYELDKIAASDQHGRSAA